MPDEGYWESLFDVPLVLSRFGIERFRDVAELGCGYGTFSVPVVRAIRGTLYAFDIDPAMVDRTRERSRGLSVVAEIRDVVSLGFDVSVDAVLLFNILHCELPVALLKQASSALRPLGEVLVIHWRHDIVTPRGPGFEIRPTPEAIVGWATEAGSLELIGSTMDLPPWHYGLRFRLRASSRDH
ncbi:MAG: class I SAM-dependent methyltransferase [Pirellulales bacterium]|nr:class I SAM-dependent methyltransferase [Pirellulales bacterium]